ncbi:MAG: hypothetical protein CMN78_01385 [Spirochaetales bacterium]|nr:hypothetical protein [Spirochaetales bacterium]
MVLHADSGQNRLYLFSLPRDLFYRGRKINDIYRSFGAAQMAKDLSEITGLAIENYIVIDMYAFIDAVNILGGLEITLPEDLIDPTYRVKDEGKWGTLFYEKGTHQLSGIEALRVARSRHYTSDFGRAERQQHLISAIKDKVSRLDLRDMKRIYDLAATMVSYVDTDLSPVEIVNLFLQYRKSAFAKQIVIDTSNVLYHTYSNLYYLDKKLEDVDDSFYKGAWILLPLEDDWDLLRWFIRSTIEGDLNGRFGAEKTAG